MKGPSHLLSGVGRQRGVMIGMEGRALSEIESGRQMALHAANSNAVMPR